MAKPAAYITRLLPQEALDMIGCVAEMRVWQGELPPSPEVLREEAANADGLLCLLTDIVDTALLDAAPRLKVISNMAVGYDNVDLAEVTRRGIPLGYTPGVLTETTADLAFALLMAAARRIAEADRYVRAGRWKTWGPMVLLGMDVHHATLGIVGLGRIGAEVAKRARGFDMRVLYCSRTRKPELERTLGVEFVADLPTMLSQSDFVSIHVPLTAETKHFFGAREFAAMKPSAILINCSRGAVVDQQALYEALRSGGIWAAATDVAEVEPIPMDAPLLTLDNITILPHIGSASIATRTKMATMAAANLIAGLRGEPLPHCANPEVQGKRQPFL